MENFEEQIRNRLRNAEVEPPTDAWQRIAGAMPPRRNRTALLWWTAGGVAAGLTWLFAVGGAWQSPQTESVAPTTMAEAVQASAPRRVIAPVSVSPNQPRPLPNRMPAASVRPVPSQPAVCIYVDELEELAAPAVPLYAALERPALKSDTTAPARRKGFLRGWHVGMGAASVGMPSMGNPSGDGMLYYTNFPQSAPDFPQSAPERTTRAIQPIADGGVRHSISARFGVAFYKPLDDRWSVSTGIVYSQLVSRWEGGIASLREKYVQRYHLVGVPVSFNYRLFSVGHLNAYAAAGVTMDVNVAGRLKVDYSDGTSARRKLHDSCLLWTVHGRVGVAYPLLRWASAYGEVGVDNYLNAPSMATLRSEKKTSMVGQLGIRIGF